MSKDTKATANTATNTAKAEVIAKVSAKVVDLVEELTDVRAEINRLTKIKDRLTDELNEVFDKAEADTLTHRNLEVARRVSKMREGTDEKLLETAFPEIWSQTRKVTFFTQINTLWKKK